MSGSVRIIEYKKTLDNRCPFDQRSHAKYSVVYYLSLGNDVFFKPSQGAQCMLNSRWFPGHQQVNTHGQTQFNDYKSLSF